MSDKKEYNKEWKRTHKEYCIEYNKSYYQKHKEQDCAATKKWYQSHRKYRYEYNKKWRQLHPEYYPQKIKEYRLNPKNHLDNAMGNSIRASLKENKAGRKWENLVGYTIESLIKHLESKFESWMNWDNYGKWDIDHIKPRSLFNYKTAEEIEFKQCWALENLQPLEHIANIKKFNHYKQCL